MAKQDDLRSVASEVENQYKECLAYIKQQGYPKKWAQFERFKAGDQWPQSTERTKNLPRPVINIIKQIENHKVASVMNENIKMVFTATEAVSDPNNPDDVDNPPEVQTADQFTRYADTTWEQLKQQQLNEEALESASNVGTGIWHYFYDLSKQGGKKTKYDGQINGETIDAANFFPGNPQCIHVQDQPYIIITYRDLVKNVQDMAKKSGIPQEIYVTVQPDDDTQDQVYDAAKDELKDTKKVTVKTKYWKENGTVHFIKIAGGVVVYPDTDSHMKLYPLIVMQWDRRKRSIYGVGDTEGLIPNQRIVNFLTAMQVLSAQLTGWPKMIVDKSQVQQSITNTPGEIIKVNSSASQPVGNAVQYMNPAVIPANASNLVDTILNYTREVTGANESALGQQGTGQPNATAIMLLQKAAGVPLESIKRRFYQSMEDVGRVWAEIWRVYYSTTRTITTKDNDGNEQTEDFTGSKADEVDMRMKIDIGPSSSYSETLMMTSLDNLFNGNHITLDQYLTFAPQNVIPFKDRLIKSIKDNAAQMAQQQQVAMQQQQNDAMIQQQQGQDAMQQDEGQQQAAGQQQEPFEEFTQQLSRLPKTQQQAFFKLSPDKQKAAVQNYMEQVNGQQTAQQ